MLVTCISRSKINVHAVPSTVCSTCDCCMYIYCILTQWLLYNIHVYTCTVHVFRHKHKTPMVTPTPAWTWSIQALFCREWHAQCTFCLLKVQCTCTRMVCFTSEIKHSNWVYVQPGLQLTVLSPLEGKSFWFRLSAYHSGLRLNRNIIIILCSFFPLMTLCMYMCVCVHVCSTSQR